MLRSLLLLAGFVLLGFPPHLPAQERYYVIIFGAQRPNPDPDYSHSFGAFIKITYTPAGRVIQYHTVSWMPANGVIRVNALRPEPGRHFGLHESLAWCQQNEMRVSAWGPYAATPELYAGAVRQLEAFQRWGTIYKANDIGYSHFMVANCVHALGGVAGTDRLRAAVPSWGETASYWIMKRYEMQGFVPNTAEKHVWLLPELGLQNYPIRYRELEPPRTGVGWSLLLGPEQ